MKFIAFKEFRETIDVTKDRIAEYLRIDLKKILRDLQTGLTKLSFEDNFVSFKKEVTIAASSELAIRNEFRDGTVPSQRIIIKGSTGAGSIVDGDTQWDQNFVYLKNTSGSTVTATVIFLK